MKRILFTITLALALSAQAQSPHLERIPGRLDMLYIHGNCTVDILRADRLALAYEHSFPYGESPFYQSGSRLIINDTAAHHYTLYYDRDTLPQLLLTLPGSKARIQTQGVVIGETKDIDQFYSSSAQEKVTQDTLPAFHPLDDLFPHRAKKYSFAQRCFLQFHWGLLNWGTTPVNGFASIDDDGYRLHTSFSDIQFELGYTPIMRDRFRLRVGLGVERMRTHFASPYVTFRYYTGDGYDPFAVSCEHLEARDHWPSGWAPADATCRTTGQFFHATFPISLIFSPLKADPDLRLGLSVIPGIDETWVPVGLTQEATLADGSSTSAYIFPASYNRRSLDLRLDLTYCNLGLYLQLSTLPLLDDDLYSVYPLRAGISLGI